MVKTRLTQSWEVAPSPFGKKKKAGRWELLSGLLNGRQGPQYLAYLLLFSQVINRELDWRWSRRDLNQ